RSGWCARREERIAMRRTIHKWLPASKRAMFSARTIALLACALGAIGFCADHATAQQSKMHAALSDVEQPADDANEPRPGTILLMPGQKPAPQPEKATPPATHRQKAAKATPPQTTDKHAPPATEELPTLPMKDVLHLAGSAPDEGLALTKDKKG